MTRPPLVLQVQRTIERTYDLDTGVADISPFIIGDEGFARLYEGRPLARKVVAARSAATGGPAEPGGAAARVLVREGADGLRACIYLPDRLVANLEAHDPARRLGDQNVDDFATLVEEVDHFLALADRHRAGGVLSLLELELHANVTKELMLELFIARMRGTTRLSASDRTWARHHLFHKVEYREEDPEVRVRYRDAAHLAVRYLDHLQGIPRHARPSELRRFHRRSHQEKIGHILSL
jgi:hypothetical protein